MNSTSDHGKRPLTRLEVLRALRLSNMEAVAATVHVSLTGGAFQTGFALWLGAGSFWMGIIGAIPTFAALVQLVSSIVVERIGERKRITAWFSLISRTLWLPILLIPWTLHGSSRLIGFVVLLTLSSIAIQVPVPAFTSWLSDLVPADHRGRYFGRRNMLAGLTAMAASLPPAWFLDRAVADGWVSKPTGFAVLFGIAVVFGLVSFVILLRQPEPPMARSDQSAATGFAGVLGAFRMPLRDRTFRKVLWFSGLFAVGQFIAGPFYTVYALQQLKLSYMWLQVIGAIAALASLASMPLWGYLSDRFGNRPLLVLAVAGVSLTPLPWIATSPNAMVLTLVVLCVSHAFGGVVWAGVGLLQFNVLIEATPAEGRSVYVAALSAVTGLAGGLAPIVGGVIVQLLETYPIALSGLAVNAYHALFAFNALIRLASLPLVRTLPASSSASASEVLGQLGAVRVGSLIQMRRLQHGQTEEERREAVSALSASRLGLAVQELTLALSDPSHRVRREAARALGEIGDPDAVDALVACLRDPSTGVAQEAAMALGRIRSERAVAPLAALLTAEGLELRISAARALARIRSRSCLPPLMEALDRALDAQSWEEAEAIIEAIGCCGDSSVTNRLVELLRHPRIGIRSAVMEALGEIGDAGAGEALEAAFNEEPEAAVRTHGAFALARTGRLSAMPALYRSLKEAGSDVARKQIANAIGALLEDADTYRILAGPALDRDMAIVKSIHSLMTRQGAEKDFGSRRRSRLIAHAAEALGDGRYAEAAQSILRTVEAPPEHLAALIAAMREQLEDHEPSAEEFVVILAAVRAAHAHRKEAGS
jgi:HEAT repeat protein